MLWQGQMWAVSNAIVIACITQFSAKLTSVLHIITCFRWHSQPEPEPSNAQTVVTCCFETAYLAGQSGLAKPCLCWKSEVPGRCLQLQQCMSPTRCVQDDDDDGGDGSDHDSDEGEDEEDEPADKKPPAKKAKVSCQTALRADHCCCCSEAGL